MAGDWTAVGCLNQIEMVICKLLCSNTRSMRWALYEYHVSGTTSPVNFNNYGAFSWAFVYGRSRFRHIFEKPNLLLVGLWYFHRHNNHDPKHLDGRFLFYDKLLVYHFRHRQSCRLGLWLGFRWGNHGEFKHEVRQFQKPYDNQQAEQISLMV